MIELFAGGALPLAAHMSLRKVQFQVSGPDIERDDHGECYTQRMISPAARPAGDGTGMVSVSAGATAADAVAALAVADQAGNQA